MALVSIWLAKVPAADAALAAYWPWLTAQELARLERFARPLRRRQFLAGRVLLRMGLGALLDVAPERIELDAVPGQAPQMLWPGACVGLSVAHSGDWAGCAVSTGTALGFDIEVRDRTRDMDALARHAFDAAACARLAALEPHERPDAFYAMWSEMEARIKLGAAGTSGSCLALPHAALSMVLCSAIPLAVPPVVTTVTL